MGVVNFCNSTEKKSLPWMSLFDFFNLYPISTGIVFACFGWIASTMFETISDEIVKGDLTNKDRNRKTEIVKLKQKYLIILELVDEIQRCFGLFLLIVISGNFCRMITCFVYCHEALIVEYNNSFRSTFLSWKYQILHQG